MAEAGRRASASTRSRPGFATNRERVRQPRRRDRDAQRGVRRHPARRADGAAGRDRHPGRRGAHPRPGLRLGPDPVARACVIDVDHPLLGTIEIPGPPIRFDDNAYAGGRSEHLHPPLLGEHNDSVRAWLDELDGVGRARDRMPRAASPREVAQRAAQLPNGTRRWAGPDNAACRARLLGSRPGTSARPIAKEVADVRVLLALGGNAMTAPRRQRHPGDQIAAVGVAMRAAAAAWSPPATRSSSPTATARRSATCWSRTSSPRTSCRPVPLDWCGAQTQATLGFVLMNALDAALRRARRRPRRSPRWSPAPSSTATTRGFTHPTKPIGRYLPARRGRSCSIEHGADLGGPRREGLAPGRRLARAARGPRRRRRCARWSRPASSSSRTAAAASRSSATPTARCAASRPSSTRTSRAALLARDPRRRRARHRHRRRPRRAATAAPRRPRPLGRVDRRASCARYAAEGQFASGSMGPKVEAACRFVEPGGDPRRHHRPRPHRRRRRRTTPAPSSYPTENPTRRNPHARRHRGPQGPDPHRLRRLASSPSSSTTA